MLAPPTVAPHTVAPPTVDPPTGSVMTPNIPTAKTIVLFNVDYIPLFFSKTGDQVTLICQTEDEASRLYGDQFKPYYTWLKVSYL